jgi:hypothetical protein
LVPKAQELVTTPYRFSGGKNEAEAFFMLGMSRAIGHTARAVINQLPMTIYYAFKQAEIEKEGVVSTGWATFLAAVMAEIGGEGGEVALERLKNTFGRIESSWRPATPEEGFEIVRRRLFEPMADRELFAARDNVVKAFSDLYRESGAAFPAECSETDYRRRLEAAFPIHPELFDRLNNDWGSLDRFQRTRGVLRLMAAVINALWEQGDKGPMIMPASIPLHDPTVQAELTRYLEQKWDAIISADVDGPNATPLAVDRENPNLQRYGGARRGARTIFMASAPASTTDASGSAARSPAKRPGRSVMRCAGSLIGRRIST